MATYLVNHDGMGAVYVKAETYAEAAKAFVSWAVEQEESIDAYEAERAIKSISQASSWDPVVGASTKPFEGEAP